MLAHFGLVVGEHGSWWLPASPTFSSDDAEQCLLSIRCEYPVMVFAVALVVGGRLQAAPRRSRRADGTRANVMVFLGEILVVVLASLVSVGVTLIGKRLSHCVRPNLTGGIFWALVERQEEMGARHDGSLRR